MQNFNIPAYAVNPHESSHVPTRGPITEPHEHLDIESVFAALGEAVKVEIEPHDYKALAVALRRVLQWQVAPVDRKLGEWAAVVAQRATMLAHALGVLDGNPSVRLLSERLGVPKSSLAVVGVAARKKFGIATPKKTGGRRQGGKI